MSLDGKRDSHNRTRPYKNGKGSYDSIIRNLLNVKSIQRKTSVISVVTKHNVNELTDIVNLAKDLGIHDIAFNPVLTNDYSLSQQSI